MATAAFVMREKKDEAELKDMVQNLNIKAASPQAVKDVVYSKLNSLVFGNESKVSMTLSKKNALAIMDGLAKFGDFKADIREKGALCVITIRKAGAEENGALRMSAEHPLKLISEDDVIARLRKSRLRAFVAKVIDNITEQKDQLGKLYNPLMFALSFLEVPYRLGAVGKIDKNTGLPSKKSAVDCSAFVTHYLRKLGPEYQKLPRLTTTALYKSATRYVEKPEEVADLKIGDVVVYPHRNGKPGHTAIIVDKKDDKITIAHASSSKGVTLEEVDADRLFKWFKHNKTMAVLSPSEPLLASIAESMHA